MSDVEIDYPYLADRALKAVVRDVLTMTAELGRAPGDHHFYIEFLTAADGVGLPDSVRAKYPERMTVVLQHQFEDLDVDADGFAVTLWFKGEPARLVVPFEAVTGFHDPSAPFALRFGVGETAAGAAPSGEAGAVAATAKADPAKTQAARNGAGKVGDPKGGDGKGGAGKGDAEVVSLDAFRKK